MISSRLIFLPVTKYLKYGSVCLWCVRFFVSGLHLHPRTYAHTLSKTLPPGENTNEPPAPPPVGAQRRTYPYCFFKDSERGNSFSVLVIQGKWRSECTSAAQMGPFSGLSSLLSSILCLNLSALNTGGWLEMRLLKGCVISALSYLHDFFPFFKNKAQALPVFVESHAVLD